MFVGWRNFFRHYPSVMVDGRQPPPPIVNMSPVNTSPFPLRLKQARVMRGLSYRELSEKMGNAVSHVALAKYEDGSIRPLADVLVRICAALDVSPDMLYRPTSVSVASVNFRKRKAFGEKQAGMLLENIRARLENYLEAEELLGDRIQFRKPRLTCEDARGVAREVRAAWDLGDQPLADVTELLEKHGIRVIEIDEPSEHFDGCQLQGLDVIIINNRGTLPVARKRFTLAHELGHLLLGEWASKRGMSEKDLEKAMNTFASEFLFPASALTAFFGGPRTTVTMEELHSAKLRYGVSICAIVYAMHELDLISDKAYRRFLTGPRNDWRQNGVIVEPDDRDVEPLYCEHPERFDRLVMRGVAEGNLSLSRAAGLLGKTVGQLRQGAIPIVE